MRRAGHVEHIGEIMGCMNKNEYVLILNVTEV
jgi:hypothetical protein